MNFEKCQLFYWDSRVWCLLSEWLLDGLAGFLTELFIKKFLGNNEARYRRYKVSTFEVFNLVDRLIAYPIVVIAMERCLICWFTIIVYNVFLFYVEVYLIGVLDFEFLLLAWLAWMHASFWFLPLKLIHVLFAWTQAILIWYDVSWVSMDSLSLGIIIYQNNKFFKHNMCNGLERLFHISWFDAFIFPS